MSSVGSLSTSTSTSIRGYGGLASGLDRDELIEGMTIGTRTKINKQEQKKQQIQWMQETIQSISDKMISFHGKYTETLTSPTNMFSSVLWGRNKITTSGVNSSKVSVSGTSLSGKGVTIMGVKETAQNAKWTSSNSVSDSTLHTGEIDVSKLEDLAGKTLTFSYNGTSKTITIGEGDNITNLDSLKENLQKQLDNAFGKDRILVSSATSDATGKLSFKTTIPGETKTLEDGTKTKVADSSSVLTLTGGTAVEALGMKAGESTRLNLNKNILESGIGGLTEPDLQKLKKTDDDGKEYLGFTINGEEIKVTADNEGNFTVQRLMDAINESKANVTVSYQESTDKFTFTSNDKAASGEINFSGNGDKQGTLEKIFGLDFKDANGSEMLSKRGTDAVFSVRYDGSDEIVELRRDSNTFEVDGLSIELKGRFGYGNDGKLKTDDYGDIDESNAVGIKATADVDKLVDTIKAFVEEYNAIVDLVNTELTTRHEKDYTPLSSEQKSELSDDEIEKWETKAKTGLLYGDSDLRSLSMDLRTVATSYVWDLEQIGITVSSTYSDNGKLSVDETKLRTALEKDPGSVEKLFTATEGVDAKGKPIYNGVATNLKDVMEKYVKTTGDMDHKGVLIRKAGSKSAAMSMTENTYYNQLKSIEELIDSLNSRLKTERDRYIKQFSSLETLISNMNSQSSYLSSMSGY